MTTRLPTYFLNHGGGPWPYVEGPFRSMFNKLEQSPVQVRRELNNQPPAVLVISGRWEEKGFAISSGAQPGMAFAACVLPAGVSASTAVAPCFHSPA